MQMKYLVHTSVLVYGGVFKKQDDGKYKEEDLLAVKNILFKRDFKSANGKDIWLGAFIYFVEELQYAMYKEMYALKNPPLPPRKKLFGIF